MKILMLIKNLEYGGAFKMFLWVAEKLASKGNDITIVTYLPNKGFTLPYNVKLKELQLESCGFIRKVMRIRRVIKELEPNLCLSFLLDANIYNILGCLNTKIKAVVCERNDPYKPHYYKLKFLKPFFAWADGAVFQLPRARKYYNNINVPTIVIPNPVRNNSVCVCSKFLERSNVVSTLGRIDIFQKRQDILVKAFAIFHREHPDYVLKIWGDGTEKDEAFLRRWITKLEAEDFIFMEGVTETPSESIASTKFFVLSSDFEGIPNALIEAMIVGLPCISTDCSPGGASLLIEDGVNGLLSSCGDAELLAKKMCWIAEHPECADKMGQEAKKIAEKFSEEKISNMWNHYLQSV